MWWRTWSRAQTHSSPWVEHLLLQVSLLSSVHAVTHCCVFGQRQADIISFLIQRTNAGQTSQGVKKMGFHFILFSCLGRSRFHSHLLSTPDIAIGSFCLLVWSYWLFILLTFIYSSKPYPPFPPDYSLMRFPQNYNLPHYRFPSQGKNYISVPGEALNMQCKCHLDIVMIPWRKLKSFYRRPFKSLLNKPLIFLMLNLFKSFDHLTSYFVLMSCL